MITNFLKVALRHLWRNRLFTLLNITGLAIGLSACWSIYRIVSYEFSFDTQHANRHQIYRVVSQFMFDGKESGNAGVPRPMAKAIKTSVAGIDLSVPFQNESMLTLKVQQATGKLLSFEDVGIVYTDPSYFKLIHYDWLAGNAEQALNQPNQVVLTLKNAQKYFPGLTPKQILGRSMAYQDTISVAVVGVVADLPEPTDFIDTEFVSISTRKEKLTANSWGGTNSSDQVFIQLNALADAQQVEKQINQLSKANSAEVLKEWGTNITRWHVLQPLTEMHFGSEYGSSFRTANKKVLYALMGLAFFILALACINYINLATAQIPQRAREIGIRKTLGSRRLQLIGMFLGETFVLTLLSLLLAYPLTNLFMSAYSELVPKGSTTFMDIPELAGFLACLILIVSLLSGLYPGWLISSFQPARILRGQAAVAVTGKNKLTLRKSLIIFQFVVAQVFIVGALIMGQQIRFLYEKDLGFNRQAVLMVSVFWKDLMNPVYQNRPFTLKQELKKLPGIAAVSLGNPPFVGSYSSNTHTYKNEKGQLIERLVYRKYADTELIPLYEIPLLAGRNLTMSDTVREFVLNETAVKAFGFKSPQDAIGKYLEENKRAYPIVGVVRDFHMLSFQKAIEPVALMTSKSSLNTFNIKLTSKRPSDWQDAIKGIEGLWKQVYPNSAFTYTFYDDTLNSFYQEEQKMEQVTNLATGIAILISCLGLFGLATLTAYQRTKEIGIRKVLGASVAGIVAMLSKDFIKLVLIAIAIASPIAWYAMRQWLQAYAYHIDIQWWMFALAGLLAIGIALLTVSYQSIKAALMNPVRSLRSE